MSECKPQLPKPTIERMTRIFHLLEELERSGDETVSSGRLGELLGFSSHSVRKDLNLIGFSGTNGARYPVRRLREFMAETLGLARSRKFCVVGLGRLGSAILHYPFLKESGFAIVAGFDSSVNRLETIRTDVKLYPAYQITEIVRSEGIELAALAVPGSAAQSAAERLAEGGIRGIVNFTPAPLKLPGSVQILNIDLVNELRVLTVLTQFCDSGEGV